MHRVEQRLTRTFQHTVSSNGCWEKPSNLTEDTNKFGPERTAIAREPEYGDFDGDGYLDMSFKGGVPP